MSTEAEPDFKRLYEINDELEQLAVDGKLTQAEFDRLFAEAEKASAGSMDFVDSVLLVGRVHGFEPT